MLEEEICEAEEAVAGLEEGISRLRDELGVFGRLFYMIYRPAPAR